MKLKLDLHPICSDSRAIETSLQAIIDEACAKRAAEVEIIPGKGSGALKKSVLRFLDRPDVKARYHRIEKDSDNWGRLFVHFRWDRETTSTKPAEPKEVARAACFCCAAPIEIVPDSDSESTTELIECPACGSPNSVTIRRDRTGKIWGTAANGYE